MRRGVSTIRLQPLGLITITLLVLLGFAIFFLSFLVAPLAILVVFYAGFAATDRARRAGAPPARPMEAEAAQLAAEALARRGAADRPDRTAP